MILKGKDVADEIVKEIRAEKGAASPRLAIIRIGEKASDLAYERGLLKKAGAAGIEVNIEALGENASTEEVLGTVERLNRDETVHGIMTFRPMPSQIDDDLIRNAVSPEKDVDGASDISMAGIYSGSGRGFPPCTAQACMEILRYYGIPVRGKKAVILGRSTVIGRPLAMMLLAGDATVTVCHSKTDREDLKRICREADILVSCMGRAAAVGAELVGERATVIDVGINFVDGRMCGDVAADVKCGNITPVPGGVGSVTSAVLMKHVAEAAKR